MQSSKILQEEGGEDYKMTYRFLTLNELWEDTLLF